MTKQAKLTGWGRYHPHPSTVVAPRSVHDLSEVVRLGPVIARGNGRAYGDSAIGAAERTLSTRYLNHMIDFDAQSGVLIAESGVILGDVIDALLPRGWFPGVVPGTKYVTLGGMAAGDVHGKNHHKDGSFRETVIWIDLMDSEGRLIRCSRETNGDLFDLTLGGMGLTGVILRLAIQLCPVNSAWIRQRTLPCANLDSVLQSFEETADATYSVAWIDCLGRGESLGRSLLMLGEHANAMELPPDLAATPLHLSQKPKLRVPFDFPQFALNRFVVRAMNTLYYHKGRRAAGTSFVTYDQFFFPLDSVLGWNRIYGREGFVQYQGVLPPDQARVGLTALLDAICAAGAGSFLAVLKKLGPETGVFSFPMDGYTLALDFPVNAKTLTLMKELDAITIRFGGRFNLTKDARLDAATLRQADPRAEAFLASRKARGLPEGFASKQSERLSI